MILSATTGGNADLFPNILEVYSGPGARILDMTYGKGVFWKNIPAGKYHVTTNDMIQKADHQQDFRKMSFESGSFNAVVLAQAWDFPA